MATSAMLNAIAAYGQWHFLILTWPMPTELQEPKTLDQYLVNFELMIIFNITIPSCDHRMYVTCWYHDICDHMPCCTLTKQTLDLV